jgi:sugar phosphate isomerase/epimerase
VHGPFLVITKTVWGQDPIQKIKRGAEFCREVGADSMIVHPPYLWERDYARWLNEEAQAFSSETGVTVAVETMYPRWVAGRRMRAYRWLEAKALYEACHLVAMDTSHVTVARQDILDVYTSTSRTTPAMAGTGTWSWRKAYFLSTGSWRSCAGRASPGSCRWNFR